MSTVESVVRSTIQDFVRDNVLFTALDVSNKVKEALPLARHREVRDLVRASYNTDIEAAGYARTPITVTLADGTKTDAVLYHPLVDSWDLDAKYDAQKREQTAKRPSVPATVVSSPATSPAPTSGLPSLLKPHPMPKIVAVPVVAPVVAPVVTTPAVDPATANSRTLWNNLFKSQPSLFPIK